MADVPCRRYRTSVFVRASSRLPYCLREKASSLLSVITNQVVSSRDTMQDVYQINTFNKLHKENHFSPQTLTNFIFSILTYFMSCYLSYCSALNHKATSITPKLNIFVSYQKLVTAHACFVTKQLIKIVNYV